MKGLATAAILAITLTRIASAQGPDAKLNHRLESAHSVLHQLMNTPDKGIPLDLAAVGRQSNPGIMPFGIIYCIVCPDIARGLALKYRIAVAADKRVTPVCVLKSRTNSLLNFVRPSSA